MLEDGSITCAFHCCAVWSFPSVTENPARIHLPGWHANAYKFSCRLDAVLPANALVNNPVPLEHCARRRRAATRLYCPAGDSPQKCLRPLAHSPALASAERLYLSSHGDATCAQIFCHGNNLRMTGTSTNCAMPCRLESTSGNSPPPTPTCENPRPQWTERGDISCPSGTTCKPSGMRCSRHRARW